MYSLLILTLSTALSLLSLKFLPTPFIWISLLFFLAFGSIATIEKRVFTRLLCVNLAGFSLVLGICEIYLSLTTTDYRQVKQQIISADGRENSLRVDHDILGYAPRRNGKWIATKRFGGQPVYQVEYTINEQGLRAIPGVDKFGNASTCVLFFGGSFTFGEGLNDNETLPYFVSTKTGIESKAYNFAYSGYGPHQALAALENNLVNDIIDCEPTHALLLTLTGHVPRSAGRELWDRTGPRYRLQNNGEAAFAGYFDDNKDDKNYQNRAWTTLIEKLRWNFGKSYLYRTVSTYLTEVGKYTDANVDLYVAIVKKIDKVLKSRYKDIKFDVIFFDHTWDGTSRSVGEKVLRGLHTAGIRVHKVKDVLPDSDVRADGYKYKISGYDDHPNGTMNRLLADYIVDHIIR